MVVISGIVVRLSDAQGRFRQRGVLWILFQYFSIGLDRILIFLRAEIGVGNLKSRFFRARVFGKLQFQVFPGFYGLRIIFLPVIAQTDAIDGIGSVFGVRSFLQKLFITLYSTSLLPITLIILLR